MPRHPTSEPTLGKHVIFLGAGASASSGYPLASRLRTLTAHSEDDPIINYAKETRDSNYHALSDFHTNDAMESLVAYLQPMGRARKMFRSGAFASLDEFCKLMIKSEPEMVDQVRNLTRFLLGTHNPELTFEDSDYYPFVQKLFEPDALTNLRADVTILSFNYDLHLDYVLREAVATRRSGLSTEGNGDELEEIYNCTSGGFANGRDQWLDDESDDALFRNDRFIFLKLHGSAILNDHQTSLELFRSPFQKRVISLTNPAAANSVPPIIFPWELEKLRNATDQGEEKKRTTDLLRRVWNRAGVEVGKAAKVSFVGLSMHEFLDEGFIRLFKSYFDRNTDDLPAFVVVNPENAGLTGTSLSSGLNPSSAAFGVHRIIRRSHEDSRRKSQGQLTLGIVDKSPGPGQMRLLSGFKDFIREEMTQFIKA